ncbi:MAG: hypothetical protein HYR73_07720 [Candidatus Eisenbacteria bacterium]|nr:hypothetical protein [Candidatus Eisenbacteria bacterium]
MTLSFAFAVALILALPVVAMAQTSRVEGMALQGDYIKDYTNIYTYPSCLTSVGNFMYAELGNKGVINGSSGGPFTFDRSVGTVMDKLFDGKWGVWGIHMRQETPQIGQGDALSQPGAGFGGADPNHHLNEGFDLQWGHKSGTTSIGLRLNRSYNKFQTQAPGITTILEFNPIGDPNLSRNIMGYSAGVGFQMNSRSTVELAGQYQSRTWELSTTDPAGPPFKWTDNGPTTYQIAARAMMQWKPNVMLVPVVKYTSFDLSEKFDGPPLGTITSFDNTLHGVQAGISSDWTMGTNDLMVWGLTFANNRFEAEEDVFGLGTGTDKVVITESLTPQVFAALETHINNWLTLRFGATQGAFQHVKLEDKTTSTTTNVSLSSFHMNIGAGVKLGTLQLDAILADDFAQNLGWLGSGIPKSYFPKVTATYAF